MQYVLKNTLNYCYVHKNKKLKVLLKTRAVLIQCSTFSTKVENASNFVRTCPVCRSVRHKMFPYFSKKWGIISTPREQMLNAQLKKSSDIFNFFNFFDLEHTNDARRFLRTPFRTLENKKISNPKTTVFPFSRHVRILFHIARQRPRRCWWRRP